MGNYDFALDLSEENTMSYINGYIEKGARVLEFGPANGRLTRYLQKEKGCTLTIVELDEASGQEAAVFAEKSYLGPDEGNIENFAWYDVQQKYDYIIFADVLEHLREPETVLEKCTDMMAEGGKFLVSIPNVTHNSVLIDLFNDEFHYDEVGLLDKTHIHFFTYKSFARMVEHIGLKITDQKEIYSSVGWNEIKNQYTDVPVQVELALRERKCGSIYQYVFCLERNNNQQKGMTYNDIQMYQGERYKPAEASCYLYDAVEAEEPYERIGQTYRIKDCNTVTFICHSTAAKFRLDLLETNALLRIESIKISDGKQEVPFEMAGHNGEAVLGNVIYFKNTDPGIVVVPFLENGEGIIEITVQFSVLQFDLDDRSQNVLDVLFCEFNGVNVQKVDAAELTEAKGYITHLEEDIAEQKHYIGHLEQDIRAIKAHIAQSEETIVEQKAYITHLEKDIAEQKGYIVHREKDIAEQKAYIEHLEKDIAELKNNQS